MKFTVVVHMALSLRQSNALPGRDDVTNCLIWAFKPFKKIEYIDADNENQRLACGRGYCKFNTEAWRVVILCTFDVNEATPAIS